MAKINEVKTLDMQNGEITRIEYGGAVYAKVDELHVAKKGDILHPIERSMDVTKDAFYKVTSVRQGVVNFIDDVSENGFDFDYSLVKLFRKVDAELTCGDRVKALRSGEFHDISRGEYGVIVDTEEYKGSDPYYIEVTADDGDTDYFRPQDLELVSGAKQAEYALKTGDIVVITGDSHRESRGCVNKIGDVGAVVKRGDSFNTSVKVSVPGRSQFSNFTHESEMRLATPAEIEKYEASLVQMAKDAVFTKAGRKPNEYRKGDVVRITFKDGRLIDFVGIVEDIGGSAIGVRNEDEYKGAFFDEGDKAEIVCFAEDRKDVA